MEKDWPKRASDHQLQEAGKDSDRAITPVTETVCVPGHLALPGCLQARQLHHFHDQLSLGQSCHRERILCLGAHGHFSSVQLFVTL